MPEVAGRLASSLVVRVALLAGVAGYLLGAAVLVFAIFRSPSSTAGIALLFVPFYAAVPGGVGIALGAAAGHLWQWRREPARRIRPAHLVSACVFVGILATGGSILFDRLQVAAAVARVAEMNAAQLHAYFEQGALRSDKFVLGAIAMNRSADRALLDKVARLEDPSLHERMGSLFPLLGENRRGYAVMRLVARHENAGAETLRRLSASHDGYVLSAVAGNPETPGEVLRRLDEQAGYLIDWGLARNPRAPTEILARLASSENEYTRSSVARNPSTPGEQLARLAEDPVWHVRRDVAMNPTASPEQLLGLSKDTNEQVRRVAVRRIGDL